MHLALIAAVARNGAIGKDNQLLWHIPQDLAFFKRHTQGCAVVMGRKTWDSLPPRFRPLPGRRNIVVTRDAQWQAPGAEVAHSLDEALARVLDEARVFVIGGGQLYAEALPRADELVLTEVHQDAEGDVFFPAWPREDFVETWREDHPATDAQALGWSWVVYRRR